MDSFESLQIKIINWAHDRGIIENSTGQAQFLKAVSEMGELADGIAKYRLNEVEDAVGDVLVCLINMCEIMDMDIVECLGKAWHEIKDRRGKMLPNGVFVKEEDNV